MSIERLAPLELRFAADGSGTISGYAVLWNRRCSYGDLVQPGAFTKTLAAHRAAGTRPLMLRAHNPDLIIGAWQDMTEDTTGLLVSGKIVTESRDGADAHALLKAGAMNGLSIGFNTVRSAPVKGGGRMVHQVDLVEISIVGRPAQPLARIASVRAHRDQAAAAGTAAFIRRCGEQLRK